MMFKPKKLLEGGLVLASLTTIGCGDDATPEERVEAAITDLCNKLAECEGYGETYVNECVADYRTEGYISLIATASSDCVNAFVSYAGCLTALDCTTLDEEEDYCASEYTALDSACPEP